LKAQNIESIRLHIDPEWNPTDNDNHGGWNVELQYEIRQFPRKFDPHPQAGVAARIGNACARYGSVLNSFHSAILETLQ
jgi:hypothetical protein